MKIILISWSAYHRRNEVLAPLIGSQKVYFPAQYSSKWLRPLDYLLQFGKTMRYLRKEKPDVMIAQCPQSFISLCAFVARIPYVIDAHNATWQSFWHRLPFTRFLLRKAAAVIVHNPEIRKIAEAMDPDCRYVTISDPLELIVCDVKRVERQVMLICSFADDEPVDVILELIQMMPDWKFVITGSISRIPASIREKLELCRNLKLKGFLDEDQYKQVLCSSSCAVVLTTREGCQPCGACEAVSSDTPLVLSKNALTDSIFEGVSSRIPHDPRLIAQAIREIGGRSYDFQTYRDRWVENVRQGIENLQDCLNNL